MHTHTTTTRTHLAAMIALTLLLLSGCQDDSSELTLGFIMPLSGELSTFGHDALDGAQLYADTHPGIRIIAEDEKGDSKAAITAYTKLYETDGVRRFIGPFGPITSTALYGAMTPDARAHSAVLGFTLCLEEFTNYSGFQCTYPSIAFQMQKSLRYMKEQNLTRVYIITSDDSLGAIATQATLAEAQRLDFEPIIVDKPNLDQMEFRTEAAKAIQGHPDVIIVLTGMPDASARITRDLKLLDYNGSIFLASDISEEHLTKYSPIFEDAYVMGMAKMEPEEGFRNAFVARYGKEPNLYSIHGYMLTQILAEVDSHEERLSIEEIINHTQSHGGSLAWKGYRINTDRSVHTPIKMLQVHNDTLVEVWATR